ncbi:putative Ty-3/Gypsy retrotransposon polyprotein [Trifolium medium]|uniref:Putative Ty-3/Gypsy retrotransposon polyprotein n=1 Tax=Trifolium medium TaxID=97028 RepID=A0A392NQE4_9FABA|nr:putative Ty-3/Gypsy retrotransposon polyprotein [Trifolium medium]
MSEDIVNFVKNRGVCQKNKPDLDASPGLLQPLPIPNQVWTYISMDFVEAHPYTAVDVAQVFLDNVFKLHGLPESITSDRDPIFLISFWNEFFKLQGVALNKSYAYHPQSDGHIEVVNK